MIGLEFRVDSNTNKESSFLVTRNSLVFITHHPKNSQVVCQIHSTSIGWVSHQPTG